MKGRKQNHMLDLLKGVAIYGVVFLHILLPGRLGVAVNCLARFAVPLFFLSAGYFSWGRDGRTLARRVMRTGKLLLAACAVLVALGVGLAVKAGESPLVWLMGRFTPDVVKDLLLFQLLPLPYSWHMWFLIALFFLYLLWWGLTALLKGRLPYDLLALLAAALLLVHLWLGEGTSLRGGTVNSLYIRNLWLDGLPFFALGCWMGEHERLWQRCSPALLWGAALAGSLLALAERSRTEFLDLHAGTVVTALALMAAALRSPGVDSPLLRRTLCYCGGELTFYIFALHLPVYGLVKELEPLAWLAGAPWLLPFAVALITTGGAVAADRLVKRRPAHENH